MAKNPIKPTLESPATPKTEPAKDIRQRAPLNTAPKAQPEAEFALGKENYVLLAIGFLVVILGFLLMMGGGGDDPNVFYGDEIFSFRRITLAPIVVLAGFVFEVWAIMKTPNNSSRLMRLLRLND